MYCCRESAPHSFDLTLPFKSTDACFPLLPFTLLWQRGHRLPIPNNCMLTVRSPPFPVSLTNLCSLPSNQAGYRTAGPISKVSSSAAVLSGSEWMFSYKKNMYYTSFCLFLSHSEVKRRGTRLFDNSKTPGRCLSSPCVMLQSTAADVNKDVHGPQSSHQQVAAG